ncbi:MAG: PAS domain-containing protein, partial [Spirochaetes bacterium]|nr:PAS domain-containing protein [Spirochaetota bacterium]
VRYRDLYERVPIGLFRYSLGGMIIDANPAFLKILGLSQLESLKSINFKKLFEDENDLKKFEQFIGSKKDILSFEAKLKKESG